MRLTFHCHLVTTKVVCSYTTSPHTTSWHSANLHLMVCDEGTRVNWHKYRYTGYRAAYLILPDDDSTPSFQDVFNQMRWWKMSNIWVSLTINEPLNLKQVSTELVLTLTSQIHYWNTHLHQVPILQNRDFSR